LVTAFETHFAVAPLEDVAGRFDAPACARAWIRAPTTSSGTSIERTRNTATTSPMILAVFSQFVFQS
jgi:hypothetical protein